MEHSLGVILLAGGIGTRMRSAVPKQFLPLHHKVVAQHSFDVFLSMPEINEIVVVCPSDYHHLFKKSHHRAQLSFALPGKRRQDSVYNGLLALQQKCTLVCVHDAVRPMITVPLVRRVIEAAAQHGAATAGMPVKFTVKECDPQHLVVQTPDRSRIWEIQTPQVVKTDLLKKGFSYAYQHNIDVTDDVSLVELLKHPVKLVEGCYTNIKITTPEDLTFLEQLLKQKKLS
jgi:2-C-methyl-D-erythritol 4-phosphate cytidylyltransferase